MHANDIAVSQPVAKSGTANFQNTAKVPYPLLQAILRCGTCTIGINAAPLVRVLEDQGSAVQNSAPMGASQ